jgi:DNA repair protein RadC
LWNQACYCIVLVPLHVGALMDEPSKPAYRIADLPADERPRERLAHLDPQALSIPELLAILLRVGVSGESAVQVGQRLLNQYKNLVGLHRAPFED